MQAQKGVSTKTVQAGLIWRRLTEQNCLNHIPTCMWIKKVSERVKPRPLCKHSRGIYHTTKNREWLKFSHKVKQFKSNLTC